ncbi:MAG: zf-HC2 domain-containing protein, partial [Deltaproteobacteria bacterium]
MKERHFNYVTLNAYRRGDVSPQQAERIEEHIHHCPSCSERLIFLCLTATIEEKPIIVPPPTAACPDRAALLRAYGAPQLDPVLQGHIERCPHCQFQMADLHDDEALFRLMDDESVLGTLERERLASSREVSAVQAPWYRRWLERFERSIGADVLHPPYPSLLEYAVILLLVFCAAFGTLFLFDSSIREQYGRMATDPVGTF